MDALRSYRRIDSEALHDTLSVLERRIAERFPDSSLSGVCAELCAISEESRARRQAIQRPILWLRACVAVLLAAIVSLLVSVFFNFQRVGEVGSALDFIQVLEPALGASFFIGALVLSLISIEARVKRRRALAAIHELRAIAHVVDMHQLTKDPESVVGAAQPTPSSPKRSLSERQLGRYLDYCTEMLSLISKLAALYIQDFPDHVAIAAVDDVESLTTGLSRKIWQKIMLVKSG